MEKAGEHVSIACFLFDCMVFKARRAEATGREEHRVYAMGALTIGVVVGVLGLWRPDKILLCNATRPELTCAPFRTPPRGASCYDLPECTGFVVRRGRVVRHCDEGSLYYAADVGVSFVTSVVCEAQGLTLRDAASSRSSKATFSF